MISIFHKENETEDILYRKTIRRIPKTKKIRKSGQYPPRYPCTDFPLSTLLFRTHLWLLNSDFPFITKLGFQLDSEFLLSTTDDGTKVKIRSGLKDSQYPTYSVCQNCRVLDRMRMSVVLSLEDIIERNRVPRKGYISLYCSK